MKQPTSQLWDDIVPDVDSAECRRCTDCPPLAACPAYAFRRKSPNDIPVVARDLCFGCYSCADACTYRAVVLPRAHSQETATTAYRLTEQEKP